jgi:hypothetical protein
MTICWYRLGRDYGEEEWGGGGKGKDGDKERGIIERGKVRKI